MAASGMFKGCDGFFKFGVQGQRSGQQAHTVGSGAEFIDGSLGCRVDARVTDQPKIAVGGVHPHFSPAHHHP